MAWCKAGAGKCNLSTFLEQDLTFTSKTASGDSKGMVTPGTVATLINVPKEAFPSIDLWQEALAEAIRLNQEEHKDSWPAGQKANDGLNKSFWITKFYFVHDKMADTDTVQTSHQNVKREGELISQKDLEVAFGEDEKAEEGPKPIQGAVNNSAGLKRGRRAMTASQNLATLVGKAVGQSLFKEIEPPARKLLAKLQCDVKALKARTQDSMSEEELEQFMATVDILHENLAGAFPDLASAKKKAKKAACRRVSSS